MLINWNYSQIFLTIINLPDCNSATLIPTMPDFQRGEIKISCEKSSKPFNKKQK